MFNEVFLDEAVCDDADLIGGEGNGWAVTQTTLHFERTGIGAGGVARRLPRARAPRAACSAAGPATPRSTSRPTPS